MKQLRFIIITMLCLLSLGAQAQQITSVHGTVSDDMGPLMGATVCEIDATGRIIESAVTDLNGNFTMKVKNPKDKIRFSYVGLKTQTLAINKTSFNIMMVSATMLKEVTVKSKKRMQGNALPIPEREISFATQTISMKEFEGLGMTTVDEALQGRIAGLDIVTGGDLGAGSTMRLRGTSSISGLTDGNPLIVVDGNTWNVDTENFDFNAANNEKFAELLNVNPEDIASITVLKDAAATAIYGSQGGSGVIEITTKRGARGKPRLTYTLKLTGRYQPKGYDLLNGDDYTMLLKESYFNPEQSDAASNIKELNYDPTFSEYEQYNNNTDWYDAVTQWGLMQNHYITVSGGGEKATFRISGGYDHETNSVIGQKLQRFSTRVNLDYNVSQRIRVSTNFNMTYTKKKMNSDNLLALALKKMPNMSIYEQYPVGSALQGEDTDAYYTMLQSGSEVFKDDQRVYINPVASANLAQNKSDAYNMSPELVINYHLLGMDEDHWQLNWRGAVYMNIFNEYVDRFYPAALKTVNWNEGINTSYSGSSKSVSFTTKHTLTLIPHFVNKDHSAMAMGRLELNTGSSTGQSADGKGLPSGGIVSPDAGGIITGLGSSYNQWRSLYMTFSAHYAYKSRYVLDFTLRADGTTKFGPGNRWGYFPSVSLRWNIIDEPWMKWSHKWLSMFSIRPSWARVGKDPSRDFLYTVTYSPTSSYLDMSGLMKPDGLRLSNMKWQTTTGYNLGIDLGFFDDRLRLTLEGYHSTVTDLLLQNFRVPSSSGFTTLGVMNNGKMRNVGWEFHIETNRMIKAGKFSMDMNVNFGNNRNEILELDENQLKSYNTTVNYENRQVLTRIQLNNPFGAIYGYRSQGVYNCSYDFLETQWESNQLVKNNYTTYKQFVDAFLTGNLPQEFYDVRGWTKRPMTAPVARNADGGVIVDDEGKPKKMMFAYVNAGSGQTGRNYEFKGGDAIYEDVNHDGNINALDIVYLGSSLPKLTGGFGFSFTYGDWRLSTQFTYRLGNKIVNLARLDTEAMSTNNNQAQAVNYRWRKEGDETSIPRALYGNGQYNTLISDRFVEKGDFLRMSYIQLSYALKKKQLTWIGLNRLSFYVSANKPFVLTKYSGVDPEVNYGGYGPATDGGQTPPSRSYTLGMTVEF